MAVTVPGQPSTVQAKGTSAPPWSVVPPHQPSDLLAFVTYVRLRT